MISIVGGIITIVEVLSYVIYFLQIAKHNTIAFTILKSSVIQRRKKENAISMTGQHAGWTIKICHLIIGGFLSPLYKVDQLRNISSLLKNIDFFLIPFVQIMTSPPMKSFMLKGEQD